MLLVDDNVVGRAAAALVLQDLGADVFEADDGEAAVTLYAESDFDLVVMDVAMPTMDGLTAIRAIRYLEREEERPRAAVLVLTANAQPGAEAESLAAGADGHLTKPLRAGLLEAAVRAVLAAA